MTVWASEIEVSAVLQENPLVINAVKRQIAHSIAATAGLDVSQIAAEDIDLLWIDNEAPYGTTRHELAARERAVRGVVLVRGVWTDIIDNHTWRYV